jgi:thiol-disulfide isomerase/thioredoxin
VNTILRRQYHYLAMTTLKCLALVFWLSAGAAEVRSDELGGIGVVLGVEGQNIVVKRILPDTPAAAKKDFHVGDRIMAVAQDKEPAVQVGKLAQTLPLLRGPVGTSVRLTIVSAGEDDSQARVVTFVRGYIEALARWGDGVLLTNGAKAPDIEMAGLTNSRRERLSDYAGKILILEFWATWCGPCQPKMADLQTYSAKYPDWKGKVVLIAASVDDNEEVPTKHLKAKGWGQTHNVWVGKDAIRAYHVDGIPTAYVIDQQGKILAANPNDVPGIVNHELQGKQGVQAK